MTAPALGITFGAMIGGKVMNKGRRMPMIVFNLIGACACILSVFDEYYISLTGKVLFGMCTGVLITIAPRVIQETIPDQHFDKGFGAMTNVGIDIVVLTSTVMVMYLPKLNKKKTNKDIFEKNTDWKYIYLIPLPLFALALLLTLCCMRNESLGYLVHKKKKEKAMKALKSIWLGETRTEYKKRYRELRKKGDVKVVDFLTAAKDAKGAMAKKEAAMKKKEEKAKKKAEAAKKKIENAKKEMEAELKKKEKEEEDAAKKKIKDEEDAVKKKIQDEKDKVEAEAKAKLEAEKEAALALLTPEERKAIEDAKIEEARLLKINEEEEARLLAI
jgi:primosomal protein N'